MDSLQDELVLEVPTESSDDSASEKPLCAELERSHLWGGRMCWRSALYSCVRCGKLLCSEHMRVLENDDPCCLSCKGEAAPLRR